MQRSDAWMPGVLLLAYGVAFASVALGPGPLAFDDHPGQLVRLTHVVQAGPAPWAWHAGWWAGYAEMQFYPPGWFYAAAALSWLSLGLVTPPVAYQTLLWITYLAPGLAAYGLLRRLLGDGWAALPGAFVVLTFTGDPGGGTASGVEGGVHIGMVAARLAWALLLWLALLLVPWITGGGPFPRAAVLMLGAIIVTHPAHAPAALATVVGAALASAARHALARALAAAAVALLLSAFWLVPLFARLGETRALAWGTLSVSTVASPLGAMLIALALVAVLRRRSAAWDAALHAAWLAAAAVAIVAVGASALGLRFLPPDRVADGAWLMVLVAGGLGLGTVVDKLRARVAPSLAAIGIIAVLAAASIPGRTLTLWPGRAVWPDQASVSRGLRLDDLWRALREAPPGRALFVRSGVPLVFGSEWHRPHTHVTALAPLLAGREIIGGTFTHASPVAAFVYRGDAGPAPLTQLAEQLDGQFLFGRSLEALDGARFAEYAERLRVAAVVALEDDAGRLEFLPESRYRRRAIPPFLVFAAVEAPPPLRRLGNGAWEAALSGSGEWRATGVAYSALWRARHEGRALPTRRGPAGDLEVAARDGARSVALVYRPGALELGALAASALGLAALIADRFRRRPFRR